MSSPSAQRRRTRPGAGHAAWVRASWTSLPRRSTRH